MKSTKVEFRKALDRDNLFVNAKEIRFVDTWTSDATRAIRAATVGSSPVEREGSVTGKWFAVELPPGGSPGRLPLA